MLRFLVPRIAWRDLRVIVGVAILGAVLAGIYGAAHDQLSYSISPEYFTKVKFEQFAYANFGLGDRVFVAMVGFLGAWWVGLIAAWFLARRLVPGQVRSRALRKLGAGAACVVSCSLLAGFGALAYGWWRGPGADYSSWQWAFERFDISDRWAFVRVAYLHWASYIGGAFGLALAFTTIRPSAHGASVFEADTDP